MFFIFNSDGQLKLRDVYNECQKEKWVPILVYRQDGKTYVPAFSNEDAIKKFVRRNGPKDQLWGGVTLTQEDMDAMLAKGWIIEEYSFPRKIKDRVEFDVEVIELAEKPEVKTCRR